jgi:regulator of sigma E protease
MLEQAQNILWLLILIGVMIMIHELGHFWAARFFDVKVETFSLGFGPRLFGFRRGETDYRVSLILFGGYVKMAGEQFAEMTAPGAGSASNEIPEKRETGTGMIEARRDFGASLAGGDPRNLLNKPRWQRLIISFAGPFMNLVLAVGLLTGLFMVKYEKIADANMEPVIGHVVSGSPAAKAGIQDGDKIVALNGQPNPTWETVIMQEIQNRPMSISVDRAGRRVTTTVEPTLSKATGMGYAGWDEQGAVEIGDVKPDFPAAKAGLKKGDIVVAVDGAPIHSTARFHEITKNSNGKPVVIEYQRAKQTQTASIQPVFAKLDGQDQQWMIGVSIQTKLDIVDTKLSFPQALAESVRQNAKGALFFVNVLEGMVERRMSTKNLSGPIGLSQIAGQEAREGPMAYLSLMAMVSLQLAVLNLMPIPILDGATILMLLIEIVMQRDLSLNVKEAMFKVGFVFIMMLVAFVIYNDLAKMLPQG